MASETQLATATSSYSSLVTADVYRDPVFYTSVPHAAFIESDVPKVKGILMEYGKRRV